ncbi:hypothetical protein BDY17DRAFT_312896 [Neohortaea acidophila]|uniref:SET domain-containing protein n=1 Tax=Neohortaea acidophila TaxID=245834 RepID=A0A6A6PJW2_9PEZI|nr:uncharacterized protein BDY17DRAFT_312896 [Neohortaea acidophila]KAF2479991.1 hypothetical protein BDY17DRAFT_312896 [Neohortaea acidophila]
MAKLYTIRASSGAGLGIFTTRPIPAGTVLQTSKPILKLPRNKHDTSPTALQTAFSRLPPEMQQTFLALHDNPALPYTSRLMRIYKSNCFGDEAHAWMWLDFSRCNHSCHPNAEIAEVEDEVGGAKLVAMRALGVGEEVRISYLGPLEDGPGLVRRRFLKETYGFEWE